MASEQRSQRILRVGVVQQGRIIDERLLYERNPVTIGKKWRCTVTLASESAPEEHVLFDVKNGRYVLRFLEGMRGRIATREGVITLEEAAKRGDAKASGGVYQLPIDEQWRGKINVGDTAVLFQFVNPAPLKDLPRLPANMQGGVLRFATAVMGLSTAFVLFLVLSTVLQLPAAIYFTLFHPPPARSDGLEMLPDRFVRMLQPEQEPPPEQDEPEETEDGEEVADADQPEPEPTPRPEPTPQPRPVDSPPPAPSIRQSALADAFRSEMGIDTGLAEARSLGEARMDDIAARMRDAGSGDGVASARFGGGDGGGGLLDAPASAGGGLDVPGGAPAAAAAPPAPRRPTLSVRPQDAEMRGSGTLDRGSLERTLRRYQAQIERCYERVASRDPSIGGRLVLRFKIDGTGRTDSVSLPTNELGAEVGQCIVGEVRRWRFDAPQGGDVWVQRPYVFQAR